MIELPEGEVVAKPAWFERLSSGGVLPPEPTGGWGRWWDDQSGMIWLLIVAGAIGLAYHLAGEIGAARIRRVD